MSSFTRETIESCIESTMRRLCLDVADAPPAAQEVTDFEELFGIRARLDVFVMAVGEPESSIQLDLRSDVPASLQESTEHRFRLEPWPLYDFVVCRSITGYAWGHHFERAASAVVPAINSVADLHKWSHTMHEIVRVAGEPSDVEGWYPWTSGTFSVAGRFLRMCFVFDLLQCVSEE